MEWYFFQSHILIRTIVFLSHPGRWNDGREHHSRCATPTSRLLLWLSCIRMVREESVSHVLTKKTVSSMARVFIGVQWFWCLDALLCIFMHLQYNSCQPSWWIYYPWWPHMAPSSHRTWLGSPSPPVDSQSLTTTPGLALHLERSWNVQPQVPLWVNHEADARNNRRGSVQWTHTLWRYSKIFKMVSLPFHATYLWSQKPRNMTEAVEWVSQGHEWWSWMMVMSCDLI